MMSPDEGLYYAHKDVRRGETLYAHCGRSRKFVELHYMPYPIVTVRIRERRPEEPEARYWGWVAKERPSDYMMIWPSEMQLFVCFPSGHREAEERGRGRVVNLVIEEVES